MTSRSRARNLWFTVIAKDDVNDSGHVITRLVHNDTVQMSLVSVETPERLHEAVPTIYSAHSTRPDDREIWHERLRLMRRRTTLTHAT